MKKQFEQLNLLIITFSQQDVIVTSGGASFSSNNIYDGDSEWLNLSMDI